MELGVVALLVFGLIAVAVLGRVLFGGTSKEQVRAWSDSSTRPTGAVHAHGPRHTGARRAPSRGGLSDAERLVQLEMLLGKGHITHEDFERTKAELLTRRPG
jgi:hypothetical protein